MEKRLAVIMKIVVSLVMDHRQYVGLPLSGDWHLGAVWAMVGLAETGPLRELCSHWGGAL